MTGFLLDTNVPSELVRPKPEPKVTAWLAEQNLDALFLSVVSLGELRKGITLTAPGKRRAELEIWLADDLLKMFYGRILPMTQPIAERWAFWRGGGNSWAGRLMCQTARLRRPL